MRLSIAPLAVLTASAVAAGAVGTAATARTRSCAPRQAQIVTSDRQAQVYVRGSTMFACTRRAGHRVRLGTTTTCVAHDLAQRVALRGAVVAVASETCGIDTGSTEVVVWRLGRRLPLARGPAAASFRPESYTNVTALVVSADGVAAWVAATHALGGGEQVELRSLVHGREAVLDSGPIHPQSLRLVGARLTWRHSGMQRTARLR